MPRTYREAEATYGKTITRVFYPLRGASPLQLPTQTPSYYLFTTQPSRADALAGTGAVSSGTHVSQNASTPFDLNYTFPAYEDPDPTSGNSFDSLWEAIIFIGETGGDSQVKIRSFVIERLQGLGQKPGTTVAQIKGVYPSIANYLTDSEISTFLSNAEEEIQLYFYNKGIEWGSVFGLNKLKLALAYKTIESACLSFIETTGDKHDRRYEVFKKKTDDALTSIALLFDGATRQGEQPTSQTTAKKNYWINRR